MAEWPLDAHKGRSSEDTDPQIHPQTLGRRRWSRGALKESRRPGMAVGLTCVLPTLSACYAARGQGFPDTHPGPGDERVGGKPQSLRGREGGKGGRQCEVASHASAPSGYSELAFFWCLAQGLARSGCSVGAL